MTTAERLHDFFNGEDISALLEVLQMWKEEPEQLLGVFVSGMLSLDRRTAEDGLRKFLVNFEAAADVLEGTEDGGHFSHLCCIVNSFIDLLDLRQDTPQAILN